MSVALIFGRKQTCDDFLFGFLTSRTVYVFCRFFVDESDVLAVKWSERQRFEFISTTFIHTQLISIKAKYRLKVLL